MIDEQTLNDIPPRWPPNTWNCYQKMLEGRKRTNCNTEAWHRRMQNVIEKPHPDIVSFCKALMGEWVKIQTEISMLARGMTENSIRKPNKKLIDRDERIFNVVQNLKKYKSPIDYLSAIASASKL